MKKKYHETLVNCSVLGSVLFSLPPFSQIYLYFPFFSTCTFSFFNSFLPFPYPSSFRGYSLFTLCPSFTYIHTNRNKTANTNTQPQAHPPSPSFDPFPRLSDHPTFFNVQSSQFSITSEQQLWPRFPSQLPFTLSFFLHLPSTSAIIAINVSDELMLN